MPTAYIHYRGNLNLPANVNPQEREQAIAEIINDAFYPANSVGFSSYIEEDKKQFITALYSNVIHANIGKIQQRVKHPCLAVIYDNKNGFAHFSHYAVVYDGSSGQELAEKLHSKFNEIAYHKFTKPLTPPNRVIEQRSKSLAFKKGLLEFMEVNDIDNYDVKNLETWLGTDFFQQSAEQRLNKLMELGEKSAFFNFMQRHPVAETFLLNSVANENKLIQYLMQNPLGKSCIKFHPEAFPYQLAKRMERKPEQLQPDFTTTLQQLLPPNFLSLAPKNALEALLSHHIREPLSHVLERHVALAEPFLVGVLHDEPKAIRTLLSQSLGKKFVHQHRMVRISNLKNLLTVTTDNNLLNLMKSGGIDSTAVFTQLLMLFLSKDFFSKTSQERLQEIQGLEKDSRFVLLLKNNKTLANSFLLNAIDDHTEVKTRLLTTELGKEFITQGGQELDSFITQLQCCLPPNFASCEPTKALEFLLLRHGTDQFSETLKKYPNLAEIFLLNCLRHEPARIKKLMQHELGKEFMLTHPKAFEARFLDLMKVNAIEDMNFIWSWQNRLPPQFFNMQVEQRIAALTHIEVTDDFNRLLRQNAQETANFIRSAANNCPDLLTKLEHSPWSEFVQVQSRTARKRVKTAGDSTQYSPTIDSISQHSRNLQPSISSGLPAMNETPASIETSPVQETAPAHNFNRVKTELDSEWPIPRYTISVATQSDEQSAHYNNPTTKDSDQTIETLIKNTLDKLNQCHSQLKPANPHQNPLLRSFYSFFAKSLSEPTTELDLITETKLAINQILTRNTDEPSKLSELTRLISDRTSIIADPQWQYGPLHEWLKQTEQALNTLKISMEQQGSLGTAFHRK